MLIYGPELGETDIDRVAVTVSLRGEGPRRKQRLVARDKGLETELCDWARRLGYQVPAARELSRGMSPKSIEMTGLAHRRKTTQFLDNLPLDLRIKCMTVRQLQLLPNPASPDRRTANRKAIEAALRSGAATRMLLREVCDNAVRWALSHDAKWLDAVVPKRAAARKRDGRKC